MEKLACIHKLTVFRELPCAALEPTLDAFVPRTFAAGDLIWRQGSRATGFTFLVAGHIKIVHSSSEDDRAIIGLFHPGDTLGHVTTDRAIDYPGTATALTHVEVFEVSQTAIYALMDQHPTLMRTMVDDATRRAHTLVQRLEDLTAGSAEQRLAHAFVRLAARLGAPHDGTSIWIGLHLSRRELAELVAVREETAIRIMNRWENSGLVHTCADGFRIDDFERLRAL